MKEYKIGVIGLGYVGLPLAVEFGKKFITIGYDLSTNRVNQLRQGKDLSLEFSKKYIKSSINLYLTADHKYLANCDFFIVTVPTPIYKSKKPDLRNLVSATKNISKYVKSGSIVIYESTVYPGLTEEVCIPIIEKITKLKSNQDFFYGYSPERINPGDKKHQLTSIKKVISGSNTSTLNKIKYIYKKIIKAGIFSAKSIKIAEAAKVIENIQRDINVAFINELQIIFDKMGLDIYDILNAASTKWNFLNFKPGLVGGHCIGIDPYYLMHKSKNIGYKPIIINSGRKINDKMGNYYARKIFKTLKSTQEQRKSRIKILIMGFTFKENCSDIRNSKVEDIYNFFIKKKFDVEIYDPWVNKKLEYFKFIKEPYKKKYDAIVITVKHDVFKKLGLKKIKSYGKNSSLIFDLKKTFNEK